MNSALTRIRDELKCIPPNLVDTNFAANSCREKPCTLPRRPTLTEYKDNSELLLTSCSETWGDGRSVQSPVFSRVAFQRNGDPSWHYLYDALGRLSNATKGTTDIDYDYDKANNWKRRTENRSQVDYSYNRANELTGAVPGIGGFSHDDHGNLACKDRSSGTDQNFTFDTLNRLVVYDPGSQGGGDRWLYYYDALGRRVLKQSEDGSQKYYFFYDGNRVVLEVVEENSSSETREYISGPGTYEVTAEIFPAREKYRPLADYLGTVRNLADLSPAATPPNKIVLAHFFLFLRRCAGGAAHLAGQYLASGPPGFMPAKSGTTDQELQYDTKGGETMRKSARYRVGILETAIIGFTAICLGCSRQLKPTEETNARIATEGEKRELNLGKTAPEGAVHLSALHGSPPTFPICFKILDCVTFACSPFGPPRLRPWSLHCAEKRERAQCRILAEPGAPPSLKRPFELRADSMEELFGRPPTSLKGRCFICLFRKRPGAVTIVWRPDDVQCIESGTDEAAVVRKYREMFGTYKSNSYVGIVKIISQEIVSDTSSRTKEFVGVFLKGPADKTGARIRFVPYRRANERVFEKCLSGEYLLLVEIPLQTNERVDFGGPGQAKSLGLLKVKYP